ncbi:uncharacterized protein L201_005301 [Kwoniella dendrophila CBS 6074]|uniref:AAA+ ATPase domain-containing protein n=1 Tax=Kwoniella dendrophila CBS 6074 TaxID=1295534 RepID=A0AAX4JZU9_9TREE
MIVNTILSMLSPFINVIKGNPALNEGFRLIFVGIFFEFSRRYAATLFSSIKHSFIATARISESDEAFDWIHNYLSLYSEKEQQRSEFDLTSTAKKEDSVQLGYLYSLLLNILKPLLFWINFEQSSSFVSMDVQLSTRKPRHQSYYYDECRISVVPSIGTMQKIKYKGKTIKIGIIKDESSSPFDREEKWIVMQAYFTTPSKIFKPLLLESRKIYKSYSSNQTSIYTPIYSHEVRWKKKSSKPNRPWESIFLNENLKEWILNDCLEFLKERDFYLKRGTPWRRGYLCFGVAGSGKSSLIGAIAAKLGLDIYLINLGSKNLDDDNLQALIQACPGNCLLLMEDIDCAFTSKTPYAPTENNSTTSNNSSDPDLSDTPNKTAQSIRDSIKSITLSGLLNALDGVASSEGRLLFCTTNWKDKIDPALSRPGRCDIWIEFKHSTKSQAESLFKYFYREDYENGIHGDKPNDHDNELHSTKEEIDRSDQMIYDESRDELNILAEEFSKHIPEETISVSALQGYLMRYKRRPELAVENVTLWIENGCRQGPTPLLHDGKVELRIMDKQV